MKIFHTIPTSENAKSFFNRYAGTIKTLKRLRTPAQVLSAITEFSVLYAIGFNSIEALNPEIAHKVGLFTGIIGTLLLEAVIRASTGKAIAEWLDQSNGNKTLRVILSFVAVMAVVSSGWLSFKGSGDIAEAISKEPELANTLEQDSTNTAILSDLQRTFSNDSTNIEERYKVELSAKEAAYKAKISAAKREKQNWRNRSKRENKSYASKVDQARLKIETLEAEKETALAEIKSRMNAELFELEKNFKADEKSQKADYKTEITAIADSNQSLIDENEANIKATGKNFGWITIVCLFFFVLITWCDEIVKYHSEQKEVVLPSEFANRENSWLEIWKGLNAKAERWRRKLAAKWTDHSHSDIELPYKTSFEVEQNYLLLEQALQVVAEQQKRGIGFHKEKESKEEFEEAEIINKKTTNSTTNLVGSKGTQKNHENPSTKEGYFLIADLTQRLKRYQKRLGEHEQKKISLERKGKVVPKRTLNAIENNSNWVAHYQSEIEKAKRKQ